ncbi:MAG: hypothetical protein AUK39_00375 [Dehalococcoidia bacterium CG2_30_46_19]|nr:MAG: hypothetical protein AUK39_00375 [Dehalococcoidia bacterium CG2_30_46_19]
MLRLLRRTCPEYHEILPLHFVQGQNDTSPSLSLRGAAATKQTRARFLVLLGTSSAIPADSPGQIWREGVRGRGEFTLTLFYPKNSVNFRGPRYSSPIKGEETFLRLLCFARNDRQEIGAE